jgi:hypothetical protein
MTEIGLTEAIAELRYELGKAMADAEDEAVRFPVGEVTLQFQVGVTKAAEGSGGVKFWVLGLTASGHYAKETVQTLTVVLGPPVDADGRAIKVQSRTMAKPG